MKQSSAVVSDEEFSRRLLTDHLSNQGKSGFRCEVNAKDPPDLLVTWEDWFAMGSGGHTNVPAGRNLRWNE